MIRHSVEASFLKAGYTDREYFPHYCVELVKQYPDTILVMERRGFGQNDLEQGCFIQVNVYTRHTDEFPDELFFDSQINWHGQHHGKKGLVGAAGVFLSESGTAFVSLLQSDLLQQIHRATALRRFKSRLENRFKSWPKMTLNAVLQAARYRGAHRLLVPTSETVAKLLNKRVDPGLFRRIYDAPAQTLNANRCVDRQHTYWQIELSAQVTHRLGEYEIEHSSPVDDSLKQVCILHDIEENVDTPISESQCRDSLRQMLAIERDLNVPGTYNILGRIFSRVCPQVIEDGHDVGFHTYNHEIGDLEQLPKVRKVDLQVKGYRPAQSRITDELNAYNLSLWNFEWLASSSRSLGASECHVDLGVAYIPIDIDDYPLYTGEMSYQRWADYVLEQISQRSFFALSLHDCYAGHWIDHYEGLLKEIKTLADFTTCGKTSSMAFIQHSKRQQRVQNA